MAIKQFQLKFGAQDYSLYIPVDDTADNTSMGQSFIAAGIALIGLDNIPEYVEELKYAANQKQFDWMADNGRNPV